MKSGGDGRVKRTGWILGEKFPVRNVYRFGACSSCEGHQEYVTQPKAQVHVPVKYSDAAVSLLVEASLRLSLPTPSLVASDKSLIPTADQLSSVRAGQVPAAGKQ